MGGAPYGATNRVMGCTENARRAETGEEGTGSSGRKRGRSDLGRCLFKKKAQLYSLVGIVRNTTIKPEPNPVRLLLFAPWHAEA
eukprot:4213019-Pyramimonas_sp.AAC.1